MHRKHVGARNELAASVWLLEQGYEVYRNVSAFGLIDILAIRDGVIIRLDVKQSSSENSLPSLSPEQIALGVKPLVVFPDGRCEIVLAPYTRGDRGTGACKRCKQTFTRKKHRQVFCADECSKAFWKEAYQLRLTEQRK